MLENIHFFGFSAILNFVVSITFSILVLLSNSKSKLNKRFSYFGFFVALWSLFYFFWSQGIDFVYSVISVKFLMIASVFLPYLYFKFVTTLLKKEYKIKNLIFLISSFIFSFLILDNKLFSEYRQVDVFNFWPYAKPLFSFYLIFWFLVSSYSVYLLLRSFRKADAVLRSQIKYTLATLLVAIMAGSTNYFLWFDINILPYGNIFVSLYVIIMSVAVLKYEMFNIKIFLTELFIFLILFVTLTKIFLSVNAVDFYTNILVFVGILISSFFLIKSFTEDQKQKEILQAQNKKLEYFNSQLKTLDERKNEFLNIASHQLRTPVTAIKGYSELILDGVYGEMDDKVNKQVLRIKELTDQIFRLVTDMLNISRIEENRLSYHFEKIDLNNLIYEICKNFEWNAKQKKLSFEHNISKEEFIHEVDKTLFTQCIENILDNSIKYTEEGGVIATTYIKDNKFYFECVDTGIGIDKGSLNNLFSKFSRASNAIKSGIDGSGIGMYLAREIVRVHKGDLELYSRGENKGTKALLFLDLDN